MDKSVKSLYVKFLVVAIVLVAVAAVSVGCELYNAKKVSDAADISNTGVKTQTLPKPQAAEGERGKLGIDANVDETTIDSYLGLPNTKYVDVRMLNDVANWEAIGGDSKISGLVEGFEVVPYPYIAPVGDLPEAVGEGYTGPTLFKNDGNGGYVPAYNESMDILCDLFPPDEDIVLMCGGGGYAGMMKKLLVSLGWNADHIWNVGGWWYYEGTHGVDVVRDNGHGQKTWDFHDVNYHVIDFSVLHEFGSSGEEAQNESAELVDGLTRLKSQDELTSAISTGDSFVYVYLPGCTSCAKFAPVVAELSKSNQISTYAIAYNDILNASWRAKVGHAPGVLIFKDGKLIDSLSADKDKDIGAYQSLEALTTWLSERVDGINVIKGEAVADIDCAEGCDP